MKHFDQTSFTIILNTASEAEYREIMELGLIDSSYGYLDTDPHADLYELFDSISGIVDFDNPRFMISTKRIDEVKKLLTKKTTVPFDVFPGLVFKGD